MAPERLPDRAERLRALISFVVTCDDQAEIDRYWDAICCREEALPSNAAG
jgi:predicted 3-demethylubiquinone-9 3-methyltransferase (glyoxalase superfamily)